MNPGAGEIFRQKRREFDKILPELLEGLDREHYPAPLREALFTALMVDEAQRGLPLLLGVISEPSRVQPSARVLAAFECCLRAYLLLAEIGHTGQGSATGGVGKKLGEKFTPAQVLLTADTLFTWPLELAAAECTLDGKPLSGEIAAALGAGGVLAALDRAGGSFDSLLGLEPVEFLCRAWAGQGARVFRDAAHWVYLRELSGWFGAPPGIDRALGKLEEKIFFSRDAADPRQVKVAELITFLKAPPS